jgi:hypothetical protein
MFSDKIWDVESCDFTSYIFSSHNFYFSYLNNKYNPILVFVIIKIIYNIAIEL